MGWSENLLAGTELLEPWPGRTWDQSHLLGLQKWVQSFQPRCHNYCCILSQEWNNCLSSLRKMVPGHLVPMAPLSQDIP